MSGLRPDALADRPGFGRVRVLLDRVAAEGSGDPWTRGRPSVLERIASELRRAQRRLASQNKFPVFARSLAYYRAPMRKIGCAMLLLYASPALAGGASNFTLVNGTGLALTGLSVRRAGTEDWKPLGSPPSAGARGSIPFKDPDCAFDIRANVAGAGPVTWAGVNLCDVKSVTLNRDDSAGAWVDYDQ